MTPSAFVGEIVVLFTRFIATEFIDGMTLRELVRNRSLNLNEILEIGIQTASALVAAHAAGIIHRDMKPDNIMVRHDGYAHGTLIGSRLIGQPYSSPGSFQSRPSAAGASGYDAGASSGSNLGPTTNQKLSERGISENELRRIVSSHTEGSHSVFLVNQE